MNTAPETSIQAVAPRQLILHRNLKNLISDLDFEIGKPGFPTIHAVIGPTGVGKTTLMLRLRDLIRARFAPIDGQQPQSRIPVVTISADMDGKLLFSWTRCNREILKVVNPALADYGRVEVVNADGSKSLKLLRTVSDLQEHVETGLMYRETILIFIDESQHILASKDPGLLRRTLDKVKLLIEKVPVTVVLFGTYELNPISELNGQLARRCGVHHFQRYDLDNTEDMAEFRNVLHSFAADNPIIGTALLDDKLKLIHRGCFGCPGTAIEWLERVAGKGIKNRVREVTWEYFEMEKITKSRYDKIRQEIEEGEPFFNQDDLPLSKFKPVASLPRRRIRKRPNSTAGRGRPRRNPKNDPCPATT